MLAQLNGSPQNVWTCLLTTRVSSCSLWPEVFLSGVQLVSPDPSVRLVAVGVLWQRPSLRAEGDWLSLLHLCRCDRNQPWGYQVSATGIEVGARWEGGDVQALAAVPGKTFPVQPDFNQPCRNTATLSQLFSLQVLFLRFCANDVISPTYLWWPCALRDQTIKKRIMKWSEFFHSCNVMTGFDSWPNHFMWNIWPAICHKSKGTANRIENNKT